ncbi:MAG: prephenate dehydratase [Desulfomicrobiaceae bacterium]
MNTESALTLEELRQRIDAVDEAIVALLHERASLSRQVGQRKKDGVIFHPFREKEVLERLLSLPGEHLPKEHLRAIYREILSSSRSLQAPQTVAYLGPEGTFSHRAALEYFGHSAELLPQPSLEAVFRAVATDTCRLGIVPLENSLHGSVAETLDLFLHHDTPILAEVFCRVRHALLGHRMETVRRVLSHPQALAQCAQWLRTHLPHAQLMAVESTAAAARAVHDDPEAAAIGHPGLAGPTLAVLATDIQDLADNWTRFAIIGREPGTAARRDKTSLLLTLPDRPGALAAVLRILAEAGLNLAKLESRPLRAEKWKYIFFMDVESDLGAEKYAQTLRQVAECCHSLRVLGSYPAGPHLDPL